MEVLEMDAGKKVIDTNKKAYHDFFILDTYECGIVLTGTEIKSVRQNKIS
ncbi:MAG: SsrA-binding protein, partial [Bacilli bacterium]|nr:SsrA-binding protein [Bacilli bacterium]